MTVWPAAVAALLGAPAPAADVPAPDLAGAERRVADKITACRAYVASRPESDHAWGVLAMNLDVHGFDSEALDAYRQAAALAPAAFRWPYYGAIVLAEQGSREAFDWFARARAAKPGYAPLLVRYGEALLADGDADSARELFAEAASAEPGLSHAHLGLARAALLAGDPEAGLDHARQAVTADPRHAEARGLLAELYRRSGENDRALAERRVERRLPAVTRLPDPAYAALVAEGVSSYWFRQRGRAYLEAGDAAGAVGEFERAVAAAPRSEHLDDLGLALQYLGRYEEAVERHRAALVQRPGRPELLVHLGTALDGAGELDRAIEVTAKAFELEPGLTTAALNLGTFLQRAGRRAEAVTAFRQGLEHAPDELRLASRLAWLLATAPEDRLRDGDEAVLLAEGVCERTGHHLPEALDVLAAAYAEAGRFAEAVAAARRALELASADLARRIAARLELYRSGRPFRASFPSPLGREG